MVQLGCSKRGEAQGRFRGHQEGVGVDGQFAAGVLAGQRKSVVCSVGGDSAKNLVV